MKKLLHLFVMFLLPIVANADAVLINGIYYNLNTETKVAEVTSNPNKYKGNVVIPASITVEGVNFSVEIIADFAFKGCSDLTSITIPDGMKSIGQYAFENCI